MVPAGAYVDGGTRLRVFDHYPAANSNRDPDMMGSETVAWQLATTVVGSSGGAAASDQVPPWARLRTGSGGIGPEGVVFPVSNLEVKVAAAMLTRPDVIFTTRPPNQTKYVTIVVSQPTRDPTGEYTVGERLNVIGYQQAGRIAANQPGTVAVVVVHDLRQVLAWLCGRTDSAIACATARSSTNIPIGTTTTRTNARNNVAQPTSPSEPVNTEVAWSGASGSKTCALTVAGHVKCWGGHSFGDLVDGTATSWLTPVNVSVGGGQTVVALGAATREISLPRARRVRRERRRSGKSFVVATLFAVQKRRKGHDGHRRCSRRPSCNDSDTRLRRQPHGMSLGG